jgi:hypothetical protein
MLSYYAYKKSAKKHKKVNESLLFLDLEFLRFAQKKLLNFLQIIRSSIEHFSR